MNYIIWSLLGMAGYSVTTLLVKLATRGGQLSSFVVLAIATGIVFTSVLLICLARGELATLQVRDLRGPSAWLAGATGIALTIAVASLFRALSLGPASVVVPLYGMFIVGGAVLGMFFLREPVTTRKLLGIALAVVSVYLIAGNPTGGR